MTKVEKLTKDNEYLTLQLINMSNLVKIYDNALKWACYSLSNVVLPDYDIKSQHDWAELRVVYYKRIAELNGTPFLVDKEQGDCF